MMTRHRFVALLTVLALLGAGLAQAMTVRKMDVEALTQAADLIVRGVVLGQHVELNPADARPYTYTTLRTRATYKGAPAETLVIRQIGGTLNGLTLHVAGTPRFAPDEEVLVFLAAYAGHYVLRGMGQGAFEVRTRDGVPLAVQKLEGISVVSTSGDRPGLEAHPEPLELPLADLERRIVAALTPPATPGGNGP